MFPPKFEYLAARSLEHALELLERYGEEAKLLAGGHSLIPAMKLRLARPRYLIDLGRVPALSGVRVEGETLVIGALTVHADVASAELVRRHVPGLAEAAEAIGDMQVRNRGTIGGSVAHADPGADFPVILTALDASFTLVSPSGRRTVPTGEFFRDFYTTVLAPNEILTEVRIPLPPSGAGTAYAKLPHPASGYVVVSAGALVTRGTSGRCASAAVALGGVGSVPRRARAAETALEGSPLDSETIARAAALAAEAADPIDDVYASADYKRHMATIYARRAIETAARRAAG